MGGEKEPKDYTLHSKTGSTQTYKTKTWGKCTVFKVKTWGKVTILPNKNCPFDHWSKDCENLSKKLTPVLKAMKVLEELSQVYIFIFSVGRRYKLPDDKRREWDDAVGGWGREFDNKVKRMQNQRQILKKNFDSICKEFYNTKICELMDHAVDPKTPAHWIDGSRLHNAQVCNSAFAEIPSAFFYSDVGKGLAKDIAEINHKDTYQKHKNQNLAIFLASNQKNASTADLLDSTVFESGLMLMDHFLPALATDPSFRLPSRGFLEFFAEKKLYTLDITNLSMHKLRKLPDKIILSSTMGPHGLQLKFETLERADTLGCNALSTVLNTIAFMSSIEELSKNKSFYSKVKGIKATTELITSLSNFSQLRKIRMISKVGGMTALVLESGLSVWDASRQARLSTSYDDRTLISAAHIMKAVGSLLMIVSLPFGAAIYLIGCLGVTQLDRDPFVEWAKRTYFGAKHYDNKISSRLALWYLERIVKAL